MGFLWKDFLEHLYIFKFPNGNTFKIPNSYIFKFPNGNTFKISNNYIFSIAFFFKGYIFQLIIFLNSHIFQKDLINFAKRIPSLLKHI